MLLDALRSAFRLRPRRRSDDDDDDFVWDVPNPFAPPDPTQAHLHSLIQAEIAHMSRYESIGPLQSLPHSDRDESEPDDESDSEDNEHADDEDSEDADSYESEHSHPNEPHPIVLPPPPPPSPSDDDDKDAPALWDDLAEAEERAARRAKRDAHRSRLKALAIQHASNM